MKLLAILLFATVFAACGDDVDSAAVIGPEPERPSRISGQEGRLITSDPVELASAVAAIGNDNELMVLYKSSSSAPAAPELLDSLVPRGPIVAGVPHAAGPRHDRPGLRNTADAERRALLAALARMGQEPYRADDHAIALRIPDDRLVQTLALLLNHPSVYYVEANQRRRIVFGADPIGSNDPDVKHTFHNILEAWDYTRGEDIRIGIIDSGFAFDRVLGQYHPDGELFQWEPFGTFGIRKLGFGDDYLDDYDDARCDDDGTQASGGCVPWDDHGHGTLMAGLAGANDNATGAVGVMPRGETVSMKTAMNCFVARGCASEEDAYLIEDDDFYWAVRWASTSGVRVLSMSFNSEDAFGSSVYNALYDAYHSYDVLLLSNTRNPNVPSTHRYPEAYSFVMGVGGVTSTGSNYGADEYQEVSGLNSARTTVASCGGVGFCGEPFSDGTATGTSTSTAIVAGIAGLVLSYTPSLSASQLRSRLQSTSFGLHNTVDAHDAVLNIARLVASIDGSLWVEPFTTYTWSAGVTGGVSPYSYEWYRDGTMVSTSSTYSGSSGGDDFILELRVHDSDGESASIAEQIRINQCGGGAVLC